MLPRIGITMGDAAGIGPEIIVKVLTNRYIYQICQPIVIGSLAIIQDALNLVTVKNKQTDSHKNLPHVSPIQSTKHLTAEFGTIDVLDVSSLKPEDVTYGKIDPQCGSAAVKAIETAVELTLDGMLDAITTAPICKAAIEKAGSPFPGHTEMLTSLTQSEKSVMMLKTWDIPSTFQHPVSGDICHSHCHSSRGHKKTKKKSAKLSNMVTNIKGDLTVSFVTNHIPVAEVSKQLSVERIGDVVQITHDALIQFGIGGNEGPRLVVAGLNPHAGEEGMFGKEEEAYILPAVQQAQMSGLKVDGPLPADSLFKKAIRGDWDAVIAMYHDQGNIPIKLLASLPGWGHIVNITLGLPIVRTSVDHGTAFDIAGKGTANETSLIAALVAAAQLVRN